MAKLPAGTVTFLFTDIEGSTRLLQRLGPLYAEALEDHYRLLRAAWTAHNGVEVDTQGDAFFVAFSRANDAVEAAVEATQALATHSWPEAASLAVRIGVHTGTPAIAGDKYVGLDIHRAARIAGAGHGGQILVSQTTRDLCDDTLRGPLSLRDLGEARLKDLPRPEHLYQVVGPDLLDQFPPLNTLDRVRHNLPTPPTPFLGQRDVVQTIVALLDQDDVRVLTLMGPGGIGKTRVGIAVAERAPERFDALYFVPLSPLTDPALVAGTISRTLGLRDGGSASAEENLQTALMGHRTLLVLDNFEQVIAAAPIVARLVASCPGVKTLVTSQTALRLRGERTYTIPPLDTPDSSTWTVSDASKPASKRVDLDALTRFASVALFLERARDVRPDFTLTVANAPAIVEICRRLDGLPLALELAAARLKVLSPQAICTRLSKRLDLLTEGPGDPSERHHTLRAAIAWSYDLLRPVERVAFTRMAVFSGGWTLEAAEAVCAPEIDALDGLSALIDHSLISQQEASDGEPRFWQLETIRAFAIDALESSGEVEAVRATHARYFLSLAERTQREARGPDARMWLERLEREVDNFRAALAWARDKGDIGALTIGLRTATALSGFWLSHGHEREGARWLRELLALAEPYLADEAEAPEELRAIYAWGLGREGALVTYLGDYAGAMSLLERSLAAERALGDRERELRVLNMLGVAANMHGDQERAARWHAEGQAIARAAGLDDIATIFASNLGDVAYYQGDLERAKSYYMERLLYSERVGDQAGVAVGQQNIGRTLLKQGQVEEAARELQRSLGGAWRLRDPRRIAEGFEGLAALAGARGESERAARMVGAAAQLRDTQGTPLPPLERADLDAAVAAARAGVDDGAWVAALTYGREAPVEQVIAGELDGDDLG